MLAERWRAHNRCAASDWVPALEQHSESATLMFELQVSALVDNTVMVTGRGTTMLRGNRFSFAEVGTLNPHQTLHREFLREDDADSAVLRHYYARCLAVSCSTAENVLTIRFASFAVHCRERFVLAAGMYGVNVIVWSSALLDVMVLLLTILVLLR